MHFGPFHTAHHDSVRLGDEEPLLVQDGRAVLPDRRGVSIRWLTGTILTGLTSVVLMGGALLAAFQGDYSVAAATNPDGDIELAANSDAHEPGAKGDRIVKTSAEFSNKQTIPVNVVAMDGDRQLIKVRPYTLITASLATRKNQSLTQEIPPFNPLSIFSDGQDVPERLSSDPVFLDSAYGVKLESEISISLRSFPTDSNLIDADETPDEKTVERNVRQSARFLASNVVDLETRALVDPARFDFNLARQPDLARLAVRITPENVSFVSKQEDETRFAGMEEKIVPIAAESDIGDILRDNDASPEEAELIRSAFNDNFRITDVEPGQRLRIAYAPSPDEGGRMRPERISLYSNTVHKATVARSDSGAYVKAMAPTTFLADAFAEADRVSYAGPTPLLYDSIYQTGLEQKLDEPLIKDLIRIFSFDVDFNSPVQPGDSIEVFYADGQEGMPEEILYASLNTGASTRKFYRFRTPDDGIVDYYDSNGQSAKKFLMRKPVPEGRFRSGFGMRRHPIHGVSKMHTGVDWAAPRGTPIMAAGNGTIEKIGWSSSYGRRIVLRHANGYSTTYNHMSGFAQGLAEGTHISQGQIIGFVGSTGLSTGPHLHYEVLVNGRFVDPMRVRLPRGRVLDGELLSNFEAERHRIDALVDRGHRSSRIALAQ